MKSIHCTGGENNIGEHKFHITLSGGKPSIFVSVVVHTVLEGGGVSGPVILKTLKMVPIAVLVIMSSSKGNALNIKRRRSYLIKFTFRQRGYNSKSWFFDEIKGYMTYGPL